VLYGDVGEEKKKMIPVVHITISGIFTPDDVEYIERTIKADYPNSCIKKKVETFSNDYFYPNEMETSERKRTQARIIRRRDK